MSEVRESFRRINNDGFAVRFYEHLLAADPKIKEKFKDTDFAKQKEALLSGIYILIEYCEDTPIGQVSINRLSEKHNRDNMNVTADLYTIWTDCFIKTLSEKDSQFSPELEKQWRKTLQPGIDKMIEGH